MERIMFKPVKIVKVIEAMNLAEIEKNDCKTTLFFLNLGYINECQNLG